MSFEITQNGKVTSTGVWELNEPKKTFNLLFKKGDSADDMITMKVIEIFNDKIVFSEKGQIRTFARE